MVHRIIWADRIAPVGVEAAMCYDELAIVTTNKIHKEKANRRQLSEANQIEGAYIIKSNVGEQRR